MDKQQPLHVPRIAELDNYSIEEISALLEKKGERQMIQSLNWGEAFPYKPLSAFSIAHSGKYIYIDFFVRCNFLRAVNYENNSPVSEDSCVEFFIAPKCDEHYWNFEFNCIGTINASHRRERKNPTRLTAEELNQVKRYASCGNRPFNEIEGLFSWNLTIAIPLELIGLKYEGKPLLVMGNFYKCASATSLPHYLSWNPITTDKPNFHCQEFFGNIILD